MPTRGTRSWSPRMIRTAMWLDTPLTIVQLAHREQVTVETMRGRFRDLYRLLGAHGRLDAIERWHDLGRTP